MLPTSTTSRESAHCIRVLLVDDHRTVLWGLGKLIESARPRMQTVGTAASAVEALAAATEHQPDLVLLDLDLGEDSGFEVMSKLLQACEAKVLILTGMRDPELRERAVLEGAKGILHKAEPAEVILNAIERVHRGEIWLDRAATARVLASLSGKGRTARRDAESAAEESLTQKEREIIIAMVKHKGAPIKVVADALCLSAHTVRNHLASIYNKLNLHSRLQLFMYARERGLDRPTNH
jgi:two-component system nitrate/nitrite response regulator NarL